MLFHFYRKSNVLFVSILFFSISFLGCSDVAFSQTEKQVLKQAEAYFDSSNYQAALPLYLRLHEKDSSNSIYNFAIGVCYFNSLKEKIKSIPYFEKVAKDKKSPLYKYVFLNLGQAYAYGYRFNEAKAALDKYIGTLSKSDPEYRELNRQIVQFKAAQELVNHPLNYPIKNMGNKINSPYPDYSPILSADESVLIFTTRRPNGESGKEKDESGQYYEDIFISKKQEDGKWSDAVGLSNKVNTLNHDASVGISADGQQLLLYKDDNGDGNIYITTLNGNEWSVPKKLNANINSDAYEPSACLSPDGNTLYFVSDRKGGYGLTDIYMSKKLPDGEWGLAQNLGPTINTEKEEDAPFIQADEKGIYFSSKGGITLGGYDIFYSALGDDGKWGTPVNIGFPINTTDDDLFYVLSANGKHAYYAALKEGGYGDKDIYQSILPASLNIALIKGKVLIDDSDSAIVLSSIEVSKNSNGELVGIYKPNAKTGKYLIVLNPGEDYIFNIKTEGFEPYTKNISIPAAEDYEELIQEFHFYNKKGKKEQEIVFYDKETTKESRKALLEDKLPVTPIPVAVKNEKPLILQAPKEGVSISTSAIYFAVNQKVLNVQSLEALNKIYSFMNENPDRVLKIEGHTDSYGSSFYNFNLSQARALACKNYLIKKGITQTRISCKGFGENNPEFTNKTAGGRMKNRCVKLVL
jgi:outer membrane protein OmpA-like peptidoglycan-associated protein